MIQRIAILGDFNPMHSTHHELNNSTRQIRKLFTQELQFDWIGTDIFNCQLVFERQDYKGLWIAPGSPYKDMRNVLDTISYVRQNKIPTLGNCGGFHHMIIEFARNVCGIAEASHEETHPGSQDLLITKLPYSLTEQEESVTITDTNSILYSTIKKDHLTEKYFCNYELNEQYIDVLKSHGLKVTGISKNQKVRAFEIDEHPFYVGTLFQPALTSSMYKPNPIIIEFIKKSLG